MARRRPIAAVRVSRKKPGDALVDLEWRDSSSEGLLRIDVATADALEDQLRRLREERERWEVARNRRPQSRSLPDGPPPMPGEMTLVDDSGRELEGSEVALALVEGRAHVVPARP